MQTTLVAHAGIACLLFCALTLAAVAAQPSADLRFVGTWELRALVMHAAGGVETNVWGSHPVGRLVYEPDGRMMVLLMHQDRNQADGRSVPDALAGEVAGYFGTYTIDAVRGIVTHHVEASLRASESGAIDRAFHFRGDDLQLSATGTRNGDTETYVLTWAKLKPRSN